MLGNAKAASILDIAPAVIDHKALIRDIIRETITVQNVSGRKIGVYPTVNNLALEEGLMAFEDPSKADISSSLANWIQISRGVVDLEPGEKRVLDLEIRVNLTARPGLYHAFLAFPEGSNRGSAENLVGSVPGVIINLEVREEIKEQVSLRRFATEKNFIFAGNPKFLYELENFGNQEEHPQGNIFIYDNRGKELASIAAVQDGFSIRPEERKPLRDIVWSGSHGFGKYKAVLSLGYGKNQNAKIQDTIFFWMIPWYWLILLLFTLMASTTIFFSWAHKRYEAWHRAKAYAHVQSSLSLSAPSENKNLEVKKDSMLGESPRTEASHVIDLRGWSRPPSENYE